MFYYIAAPTFVEAHDAAIKKHWRLPYWRYVYSVETLRGLRKGTTIYITADMQVTIVRARLAGKPIPSIGELLANILAECSRREFQIEILS